MATGAAAKMARVLLIDDEQIVRKVVRVVLEAEGHEVIEAADGPSGLEAVRLQDPDAIVLDLMMPGVAGTDVCLEIKGSGSRAKVIVLTSLSSTEAEAQAHACGADDFMEKPFSSLELLRRVGALLEAG